MLSLRCNQIYRVKWNVEFMKAIGIVIGLLFLSGCTNDSYDEYLGYWQRVDNEASIIEIVEIDNAYWMRDRALQDSDRRAVLTKQDNILSLQGAPFSLSDDKETLKFNIWAYRRISSEMIEQKRQGIETAALEKKEKARIAAEKMALERKVNQEKCDKANAKYLSDRKAMKSKYGNNISDRKLIKERNQAGIALEDWRQATIKEIPNCRIKVLYN